MQIDLVSLIPDPWRNELALELLENISKRLGEKFLPDKSRIFRALEIPPSQVKVIIIGQDPYPNHSHATGLAFSVDSELKILPASLQNIFKELKSDLGLIRATGDLSDWAQQGVLLLNMSLTVSPTVAASHAKIGWQLFTESIVRTVSSRRVLAILWGNQAQQMRKYFAPADLIMAPHPSPLSAYRGFFGSQPFSKANSRLEEMGLTPIKW